MLLCQDFIAVSTLLGSVAVIKLSAQSFVGQISEFFTKCAGLAQLAAVEGVEAYLTDLVFSAVAIKAEAASMGPTVTTNVTTALKTKSVK